MWVHAEAPNLGLSMLPPPVTLKPLRAFEYLSCDFGSSFSISCSLKAPS